MIVPIPNDSIDVVIYFVQLVLIIIFNQWNLNVHVVLPSTEKFEVQILWLSFDYVLSISIVGNQPIDGTMTIETSKHRLPGYEHDSRGSIRINYHFPNGIQDVSNSISTNRSTWFLSRQIIPIPVHRITVQLVMLIYPIIGKVVKFLDYYSELSNYDKYSPLDNLELPVMIMSLLGMIFIIRQVFTVE